MCYHVKDEPSRPVHSIEVEFAFAFGKAFWGQSYAYEACQALIEVSRSYSNLEYDLRTGQRGKRGGAPRIHKVKAKRGLGWGGHLGFAEMHPAFLKAIRSGKQPLTSVANCIDGTLLAIAAEESIRGKKIITIK